MSSVREVAKRSGVSTATVSRVLNGDAASVSEATRDRVLLAVRELNYRVRPAPRAGSEARTAMIAVLVADVDGHPLSDENNGYFSGVFDGVLAEAATLGYSTIVHIERMWHDVGQVVRRTFDGHCDGVLFVGTSDQTPTVRALWERGVPLVIAGAMPSLPNVSSVDITNERSAFEATTELIRQGHRRIAYFGPDGDVVSSVERRAGYRRALAVAGLAPREYLSEGWAVRRPSSSTVEPDEGGLRYTEDLVGAALDDGAPDAILVWTAGTAVGTQEVLGERGLRVPEDVSIWSFDDSPSGREAPAPLTTFAQPLYQIGQEGVRLLMERIARPNDPARHVRLDPQLVVRASVAPRTLPPALDE